MPDILAPKVFSDICALGNNRFSFSASSYENGQLTFSGLCMPSGVECKYTVAKTDTT